MEAAASMRIDVGASEDPLATFVRDQLLMLRCASEQCLRARVWRRSAAGLSLGRFHRADPASFAWSSGSKPEDCTVSRRFSGGRIVPVGPQVVCITIAAPRVDWFDRKRAGLRPEQVLNRAIRPLLAMLRKDGVEAFYPGRDLVTVAGRPIAHLSFTVMRDGVALVEMHIAERPAFAELPRLLDRGDPRGVAGVDRDALVTATSLLECGAAPRSDEEWAQRLAAAFADAIGCETSIGADADGTDTDSEVTPAHVSAAQAFSLQPGPPAEGAMSAASVAMLGVVECTARLRGDRICDLVLTGDLIAPFHTIDDIRSECEGQPLRAANVRKALARVMAQPRSFVLGIRDIDELILRLAPAGPGANPD